MSAWTYNGFWNPAAATLEPGVLDESAERVFTMGHCHSLALAIQELTGAQVVAINTGYPDDPNPHVLAEIESGIYLDIKGTHCEDEALEDDPAEAFLDPVEVEDIEDWIERGEYRPLRVEDALPYARALLEREGYATAIRELAAV